MSTIDKVNEIVELSRAPAKQWRNRWLVVGPCVNRKGDLFPIGSFFVADKFYPSYDIAETKAHECINKTLPRCDNCPVHSGVYECSPRGGHSKYDKPVPA